MSITVSNAIKNRASNEEILTVLKEVPNPNQEDDDGLFPVSFYLVLHEKFICALLPFSYTSPFFDYIYFSVPPDEGESFNPLKIDVFLQTLLNLAAKSFSHSFSALGK